VPVKSITDGELVAENGSLHLDHNSQTDFKKKYEYSSSAHRAIAPCVMASSAYVRSTNTAPPGQAADGGRRSYQPGVCPGGGPRRGAFQLPPGYGACGVSLMC
jgi:hypothetical protein